MKKSKQSTNEEPKIDNNTRAVFDRAVQRQGPVIYKVLSMGTCVEFTDRIGNAEAAFKATSKPKEMWRINGSKSELLRKEIL